MKLDSSWRFSGRSDTAIKSHRSNVEFGCPGNLGNHDKIKSPANHAHLEKGRISKHPKNTVRHLQCQGKKIISTEKQCEMECCEGMRCVDTIFALACMHILFFHAVVPEFTFFAMLETCKRSVCHCVLTTDQRSGIQHGDIERTALFETCIEASRLLPYYIWH